MSDDTLRTLHRVLVITGEDELLAPENFEFFRRLSTQNETGELVHIIAEDIHAYVLHHQNPIRLVARALGMEWLFSALNPQQARAHVETGCDSPNAHAALLAIANFLLKPQQKP
jgi:acetyl esterase/lipase